MPNEPSNIETLLSEKVAAWGYELVQAKLSGNKNDRKLLVVVDRVEPISLDDIVALSEKISLVLDEEDPIEGAYTLDVSSLGAEKPLKLDALEHYLGHYVHLHLKTPYKGLNDLEGTLSAIDAESLTLTVKDKAKKKAIGLKRSDVDKARLAIEF